MDLIEKLIGELPEIDLGEHTFADISGSVWVVIFSFLFMLVMIIIGYRNGIVTELGGLVAIIGSFLILRIFSPTIQHAAGELSGLKKFIVYAVIAILVYIVIKKIMLYFGRAVRHVPVVGFISGVFGAAIGFIKSILILLLVQMMTDIDIFGALFGVLNKIPS